MRGQRLLAASCAAVVLAGCTLPWSHAPAGHRSTRPRPTPVPGGAQFTLDGSPASGSLTVSARSLLRVTFTRQVAPAMVKVTVDGQPVPTDSLTWSDDLLSVVVPLTGLLPYRQAQVAVAAPAPVVAPAPVQATMLATVPANSTTGVQPGFRPQTPIEVVVENSGPARPQSGLQDADLVYEYLSEYSTTRMTAIYFYGIPGQVGPVRSCRMINPYIGFAYSGYTVCSGVSGGTSGWILGTVPGAVTVPNVMEVYDKGSHFVRVGFRAAPHNLYTTGDRAERLRSEAPQPAGAYAVDPPHADVLAGQPAAAPQVPLHGVTYAYDPGSAQYYRYDHGTPFVDQETGQQLHAKNVVLLHVPFHDAGWVEDENGGAHSVWYHMLGSGPAEVYSDGQVVNATWHMGTSEGQLYFQNHTPVWFTDAAGKVLVLNTGLTWIHVLGNGQERCPESPAGCA